MLILPWCGTQNICSAKAAEFLLCRVQHISVGNRTNTFRNKAIPYKKRCLRSLDQTVKICSIGPQIGLGRKKCAARIRYTNSVSGAELERSLLELGTGVPTLFDDTVLRHFDDTELLIDGGPDAVVLSLICTVVDKPDMKAFLSVSLQGAVQYAVERYVDEPEIVGTVATRCSMLLSTKRPWLRLRNMKPRFASSNSLNWCTVTTSRARQLMIVRQKI